jgi:hypothetical protein
MSRVSGGARDSRTDRNSRHFLSTGPWNATRTESHETILIQKSELWNLGQRAKSAGDQPVRKCGICCLSGSIET